MKFSDILQLKSKKQVDLTYEIHFLIMHSKVLNYYMRIIRYVVRV